ncbi:MAG: flagellar hook-associated protein FlgK [Clostridia bacterium]|nr:flagellar hook-associated protein FlgK [Clostridia bacterium]
MPSLFFTLNIARRGLSAQQAGMHTTSHNIANANTPGFSRQRAVLETTTPWPVPSVNMPAGAGQIGTGVEVSLIERIRDTFLDRQIRNELATLGLWEQRRDALEQVEVVFMEPGETGLATLLGQFWDSWQELSKYPESMPVRTTVIETAQALAEALRHTHAQLTTIRNDLNALIGLKVEEVNTLARQIADLNKQIVTIKAAGISPNDLLDRRDLLLDELSKLVEITVTENDSGAIAVKLAGQSDAQPLVDGSSYNQLFASQDADAVIGMVSGDTLLDTTTPVTGVTLAPGRYQVDFIAARRTLQLKDKDSVPIGGEVPATPGGTVELGDQTVSKTITVKLQSPLPANDATVYIDVLGKKDLGGELEGLLIARDDLLQKYLDDLNTFAQSLANAVNDAHRGGIGLDNSFNLDFFVGDNEEINAANIKVNPDNPDLASHPEKLAAGLWRADIVKEGDSSVKLTDDARLGPGIDPTAQYSVKVTVNGDQVQVQLQKGGSDVGTPATWREGQWLTIGDRNSGEAVRFLCGQRPWTDATYTVTISDEVAPGDGTNALAIAQLRRESITDLGGFTFDDYYKNFIAHLGVAAHEAQRMVENQNVLVEQLNKRKESISGVSLDEEMVNLIQYQYAYQAAARVITVVDEMLDTLINRMAP